VIYLVNFYYFRGAVFRKANKSLGIRRNAGGQNNRFGFNEKEETNQIYVKETRTYKMAIYEIPLILAM